MFAINEKKRKFIADSPKKVQDEFNEIKIKFKIFEYLKEYEKIGKSENENEQETYYIFENRFTQYLERWWYNENREKTFQYLDTDFIYFMGFLDRVLDYLNRDLYGIYLKLSKDVAYFIDQIIPGLYNLKQTYKDEQKIVAKVDSIILTFLDFKEKVESHKDTKRKKHKGSFTTLMI